MTRHVRSDSLLIHGSGVCMVQISEVNVSALKRGLLQSVSEQKLLLNSPQHLTSSEKKTESPCGLMLSMISPIVLPPALSPYACRGLMWHEKEHRPPAGLRDVVGAEDCGQCQRNNQSVSLYLSHTHTCRSGTGHSEPQKKPTQREVNITHIHIYSF